MNYLKRVFCVLLLFLFIFGQVFSDITASGIIRFTGKQIVRRLVVPADNLMNIVDTINWAAGKGEGGVLFIATAEPENKNINKKAITLKYDKRQPDGSRLQIKIGWKTIKVKDIYDYIILPIASYVDSGYINGMTLLGGPDLDDESEILRTAIDSISEMKTVYWAGYNSSLVNTLIGYNAYLIDSFFIDENYLDPGLRGITTNLEPLKGYNYDEANPAYSQRMAETSADHARKIYKIFSDIQTEKERSPADSQIEDIESRFRRNLIYSEEKEILLQLIEPLYNSYIFSDPDEGVTFSIKNGRIEFDGTPHYHFLKLIDYEDDEDAPEGRREVYTDKDEYAHRLTNALKADDSKLVRGLNPAVFDTIKQAAQWSAFFRYVKKNNPSAWNNFIKQIEPKTINPDYEPNLESDGFDKEEYNKYRYVFDDPKYFCPTPRSLDFLENEFEEAYNKYLKINESQFLHTLSVKEIYEYESLDSEEQAFYRFFNSLKSTLIYKLKLNRIEQKELSFLPEDVIFKFLITESYMVNKIKRGVIKE